MTDNEIIKALECCNRPANQTSCDDCPYQFSDEKCSSKLIYDALDLINRQKAEIECTKQMLEAAIAGHETLQKSFGQRISAARRKILFLQSENEVLRMKRGDNQCQQE